MNQEEQYIFAKGVAAGLRIAQELNTIKTVKTGLFERKLYNKKSPAKCEALKCLKSCF